MFLKGPLGRMAWPGRRPSWVVKCGEGLRKLDSHVSFHTYCGVVGLIKASRTRTPKPQVCGSRLDVGRHRCCRHSARRRGVTQDLKLSSSRMDLKRRPRLAQVERRTRSRFSPWDPRCPTMTMMVNGEEVTIPVDMAGCQDSEAGWGVFWASRMGRPSS